MKCSICRCDTTSGPDGPARVCSLAQCGHEVCNPCMKGWILLVECTVTGPGPSCPHCRCELQEEEITRILGRTINRKTLGDVLRDAEKIRASRIRKRRRALKRIRNETKKHGDPIMDENTGEDDVLGGSDSGSDESRSDEGKASDEGESSEEISDKRICEKFNTRTSLLLVAILITLGALLCCGGGGGKAEL